MKDNTQTGKVKKAERRKGKRGKGESPPFNALTFSRFHFPPFPHSPFSLFIFEDEAFFADGPAVFFVHVEAVEVFACVDLLTRPGFAFVAGAENVAGFADDPAVFVIGKIDTQERCFEARLDLFPCRTAVRGSQYYSRAADDVTLFAVAKIDVKERRLCARVLFDPRVALVRRSENNAVVADDPAALISVKIEVKQLSFCRERDPPPRVAAVFGSHQQRIDDDIVAADTFDKRADNVAAFFVGESDTQEIGLCRAEFAAAIDADVLPTSPRVARDEHLSAGDEIAVVFVAEVNFVYVLGGVERILRPGPPAVRRRGEIAFVARDPAFIGRSEVNRNQIAL